MRSHEQHNQIQAEVRHQAKAHDDCDNLQDEDEVGSEGENGNSCEEQKHAKASPEFEG